jgi:succinylglutamate desuccinylase
VPRSDTTASRREQRLLGWLRGSEPGPMLIVVGGLHGNEPSGVAGLERVLARVGDDPAAIRGDFVAILGNLEALARQTRFLVRDLNRCWSVERIAAMRARAVEQGLAAEDREEVELLTLIEEAVLAARGRVYVLDMHSTSGGGSPFAIISDTLRSRDFARPLPVPIVLGLEEELSGTMLTYLGDIGLVTLGFESGQHDDPVSVDRAAAAIWICLESAGVWKGGRGESYRVAQQWLAQSSQSLPRFLELRHRHPVGPGDDFRMEPGFVNFQPVRAGQLLARDRGGEIRSPARGRVLMPLYQSQGEDGFFLVREFSPFWLRLSRSLRRLRLDRVVHWLPGVRRHATQIDTYRINRRVARWFALEIFHLLGFRRHGEDAEGLTVSRRPFDKRS